MFIPFQLDLVSDVSHGSIKPTTFVARYWCGLGDFTQVEFVESKREID
mgnify:CR=1 FL=1|jgi:hypothetical protein